MNVTTAEFQADILQHARLPSTRRRKAHSGDIVAEYIAARRKTVRTAFDLGVGTDGIRQASHKVALAFVRRWMLQSFALLDTSFLASKQHVFVEFSKDTVPGEVQRGKPADYSPSFVSLGTIPIYWQITIDTMPFITNSPTRNHSVTHRLSILTAIRGKRGERQVSLSAAPPNGLTACHRSRAASALAHLYRGQAECLEHGVDLFEELANSKLASKYRSARTFDTYISVIWAPFLSDMVVNVEPMPPTGDPAIVLDIAGVSVLLDFYDAPNEGPIESIIREFSEGAI